MHKLVTTAGAILLATSFSASAIDGVYMGPSITGYYLDSDSYVSGAEQSLVGGLNLGYRFSNDWALEAGVGTDMAGKDADVAKLDFLYYFGDEKTTGTWRPYFVGGFAYMDRDSDNIYSKDEYSHYLSAGLGLSGMIKEQWELRGDVRVLQGIREDDDNLTHAALNLALNYYFNKPAAAAPMEEPMPAPAPQAAPETRSITVRLNVEFEFDKDVVRAIYGDELQAIANAMKVHDDIDLVLEGHTDAKGSDEYNQDLSERRAAAVKAKIVEDYGIDTSRITSVGYGESRPIADNDTDEGRARNRRVIGEMTYTEVVAE